MTTEQLKEMADWAVSEMREHADDPDRELHDSLKHLHRACNGVVTAQENAETMRAAAEETAAKAAAKDAESNATSGVTKPIGVVETEDGVEPSPIGVDSDGDEEPAGGETDGEEPEETEEAE